MRVSQPLPHNCLLSAIYLYFQREGLSDSWTLDSLLTVIPPELLSDLGNTARLGQSWNTEVTSGLRQHLSHGSWCELPGWFHLAM